MIIQPRKKSGVLRHWHGLVCSLAFALTAFAQDAELFSVKLGWSPPEGYDHFSGLNTNGAPVHLTYFIRHSTNVTATNWPVVLITTNHTGGVTVSNLSLETPHFFTISASNFFLESEHSAPLSIPAQRGPKSQPSDVRFIFE